ncbi:MAG: hypothetical protein VSS75_027885 [Candidatus Parabeggiatoa sp.]|nr:hypothetical protein [Candidatus Parabeggiatoa sp.]
MPNLRERDIVLHLFALIAKGSGYFEVHASDSRKKSAWRRILSEGGTTLEDKYEQERQIVAAVRHEVAQGLHLLLSALHAEDTELRHTVASALQFYPAEKDRIVVPLKTALELELDEEVRQAMRESLDVLGTEPA